MLMNDTPRYGADLTHGILWYDKPPASFLDGLPVGTGRLAAMVAGDSRHTRLALNHEWLWRGMHRGRDNPASADRLPEVRRLLLEERWEEAATAANEAFGGTLAPSPLDPFCPAGDLHIESNHGFPDGYRRDLNLDTAQVSMRFNANRRGVCRREVIAHLTEDRILVRLTHEMEHPPDVTIWLDRIYDPGCSLRRKAMLEGARLDGAFKGGVRFRVQAAVRTDGVMANDRDRLIIRGSREILISINIGVGVRGRKAHEECGPITVPEGTWDDLVASHRCEHRKHYGGLALTLPHAVPDMPTDRRIAAYRRGADDPCLPLLYFNFGRYLLCASCANAEQPANLQGKWNEDISPAWDSDLHQNINLQMCYWAAEAGHLQAYTNALFTHMETFVPHGRRAARRIYGCRGVWMPIATDPWGLCTPGMGGGWGVWIGAAAWLAQHMWLHWEYGRNREFLRNRAYPFFREVAAFYEDYLVEGPDGRLMIAPSQSPENRFEGSGSHWPVSIGISSAMDVELAHDAFRFAIESSRLLQVDARRRARWQAIKERLPEPRIGTDGRLLEWDRPFVEPEPGHRHMSHLYALYPGDQITPETPDLWEAARKSLEFRLAHAGGHTGWSRAWVACLWARLGEGDRAMEHLRALVTDFATDTLLDLHPPMIFQIDGNLGGTAAVLEMLLQSYHGEIHFLPALPTCWPEGEVRGLRARGGFEVDMRWTGGRLAQASIHALAHGACRIRQAGSAWRVTERDGRPVGSRTTPDGRLTFEAVANGHYIISTTSC